MKYFTSSKYAANLVGSKSTPSPEARLMTMSFPNENTNAVLPASHFLVDMIIILHRAQRIK